MKRLLTLLVMAALTLAANPATASVTGTPHDFTGSGGFGLCQVCHVPHAASSTTAKRLWRVNITMAGSDTGTWGTSVTGQLCGDTCHESGAVIVGQNHAGQTPHQAPSIYLPTSHGRTVATLGSGAGNIRDTLDDTGRPYMSKTYMECTSCHNPHDDTVRPFLRTVGSENTISKVCGGCHDRYSTAVGASNTGPINTATGSATGRTVSMHPVDKTFADDPANNTDATNGTTQFHEPSASVVTSNVGTNMKNFVNANYWVLGGKFQSSAGAPITASYTVAGGTDQIGCQTCHSIHAPATTNDNGVAGADLSQGLYLLAIDNSPSANNAGAALCEDCHGGGYNGANLASPAYVGALYSKLTGSNQTLRDHPIDQVCDGTPKLEAWNNTTRYERRPTGAPAVWPFVNTGTYAPTNNTNLGGQHIGLIICTSCHSAHNAKTATSLNRSGGDATQFCFSCHLSADMVPGNHHSTTFDGTNGGNWASSKAKCADCHQASGGVTTAHMGFFNLNVGTSAGNADSELCNSCHTNAQLTEDPVYAIILFPSSAPNGHLSDLGNTTNAKSHYLGTFANAANSINVKTGYWKLAVNNGRTGSSYSKYGNTVSPVDTHNNVAPTVNGTSLVICESCHSVLYNCGDGSLTGGYNVNLLLQNYEDNTPGTTTGAITGTHVDDGAPGSTANVGSGLCVACHNNNHNADGTGTSNGFVAHSIVNGPDAATHGSGITPANMHPMTGWTITRAVDAGRTPTTLITGAGSYADQTAPAAAPNAASYDASNAMSCDGCHRPHRAATYGVWKPGYKAASVSVILESAGPNNGDYGTLCQQCHNM